MVLNNDKDVTNFLINRIGLEVGSCYFQRFDAKTQLIIELHDKITTKQIRKIEVETGTELDNIQLHYNPIEDHTCIDLVLKK